VKYCCLPKHPDTLPPFLPRHMAQDPHMTRLEAIRDQFTRMVEGPEKRIDLVEAAVLIARTAFPDLSSSACTEPLDRWAERLQQRLGVSPSAGAILEHLNRILFDEEGFRGDQANYYDPQNSFINRVLERRLGIPITLSIVYSEVGRRAGFPLHGIALPGHFIAGLFHVSGMLFIDPFNQGEILTDAECRRTIEVRYGAKAALDTAWRIPAGPKTILKRMLRNLKGIYHQLDQAYQSFEMIQWILAVDPDSPAELKERGLLYNAMGNGPAALRDLERYLELSPESADNEMITNIIDQLRQSKQWLQ
jgi:regulator of sirC expression with transglutaminase-like and TPR domain